MKTRRINMTYLFLLPIIVDLIVPFVKYRISILMVLPFGILWCFCNISGLGIFARDSMCKIAFRIIFMIFLYYSLETIYAFFGCGHSFFEHSTNFTEMGLMVMFFLVFHHAVHCGEIKELRFLVLFTLGCYLVCAITTIVGLNTFDSGARSLSGGTGQDALAVRDAMRMGMGGYGYVYAMMFLIVPMIEIFMFSNGPIKILFGLFISAYVLCVVKAGFSTATAILLLGCGMLVCKHMIRRKFGIVLATISLLFIVIAWNPGIVLAPFAKTFASLADSVGNENYALRLRSMSEAAYDVEGAGETEYAVTRMSLGKVSWDSFLTRPIQGYGTADLQGFRDGGFRISAGHSTFFDRLAHFGLIGFFVFLGVFCSLRKYMKLVNDLYRVRLLGIYDLLLFQALLTSFVTTVVGFQTMINFVCIVPAIAFCGRTYAWRDMHIMGKENMG